MTSALLRRRKEYTKYRGRGGKLIQSKSEEGDGRWGATHSRRRRVY
jgi:hypothetical protein